MKNKYLTKCLCISLMSAMVLASPLAVLAADVPTEEFVSQVDDTFTSEENTIPESDQGISDIPDTTPVTPDPTVPAPSPDIPTPTPDNDPVSPTPVPDNDPVSPTPVPDNDPVSPTPVPDNDPVSPTPVPDNDPVSPTPVPDNDPVSPTPVPDNDPVSPTPTPDDDPVSPTPTPDNNPVSPTPTPDDPTTTPEPLMTEAAKAVVDRINELALQTITLEKKGVVSSIRLAYDALTEDEKAQVSNYQLLLDAEETIAKLEQEKKNNGEFSDTGNGTKSVVQIGQAVYITNMVSNLHAGKDFYLNSLKDNYQLNFSEDFSSVMDEIEQEYKEKKKLIDADDTQENHVTSSEDTLLVRNWQDILAIYIYEKSKDGETSFTMDASCKDDLAKIFAEMNPVIRDKHDITLVTYGNRHINYYIKKNKIPKSERKVLKKYMETDCKLLCAVVTAAKGFVRQSVGDNVSEERVNVISAAYSLVGEVGYFWGGKSTAIGKDANWGRAAKVTAEGSRSTGTLRAYGLDCSGFVTWAVINGYQDKGMQPFIGDGTSNQWENANVVSEANAQPGDLVFQRGPEAGVDNHVGILCGKTDAGDWIAVHCSSSQNGVTVGEAYGASFRYIRQPSFYPSKEAADAAQNTPAPAVTSDKSAKSSAASDTKNISSGNVSATDSLQDVIKAAQNSISSGNAGNTEKTTTTEKSGTAETTLIGPMLISSGNSLTNNLPKLPASVNIPKKIVLTGDDIQVFTGKESKAD